MFFEIWILKTKRCFIGKSLTREMFCGVCLYFISLNFSMHNLLLVNIIEICLPKIKKFVQNKKVVSS
jgi:hypothetical protein